MSKVACTRCGVSILASTANKNHGLCAPCKSGTRESIESAKQWRKEQKEREANDPILILWRNLARREYETLEGFEGFSKPEKEFFAVGLLEGAVYRGGFDSYFSNSPADYFDFAISGLKQMNANNSLDLLRQAKDVLFGNHAVSDISAERQDLLLEISTDQKMKKLSDLDDLFYEDKDDLASCLLDYAKVHDLVPLN